MWWPQDPEEEVGGNWEGGDAFYIAWIKKLFVELNQTTK